MLNTESRNKVQESILNLASHQLKRSSNASMLLGKIAGSFLDYFIVNLKAELDDLKKVDEVSADTPIPPVQDMQIKVRTCKRKTKKKRKLLPESFVVCEAVPRCVIINTNVIVSALNRMNFPVFASQIEKNCIQMNIRKRDECFAALRNLPFVSGDSHLMLAKDLEEGGTLTTPEEVAQMSMKRKKSTKKKAPIKKKRNRSGFFF